MVVAQLVEWSLPIPEVRGSNPVIRKIYLFLLNICLLSTVYWKDENKEKDAGDGPFKKRKSRELPILNASNRGQQKYVIEYSCSGQMVINVFKFYNLVPTQSFNILSTF